jgi:uncharacterized RDD family membrane protein YckC
MRCGAPLQQSIGGAPVESAPVYGVPPEAATGFGPSTFVPRYAGFWLRFAAALLDAILVFVITLVIFIPLGIVLGIVGAAGALSGGETDVAKLIEGPLMALNYVVSILLQWLYEAGLTASAKQATLGKLALGIKVTDLDGKRISFGRASGRHFAKYLSTIILLVGYLMQPFTQKKQALHDILAATLVVKQ